MKTHISDVLQIAAAIVITGGLVASAAPLPQTSQVNNTKQAQVQTVEEPKQAEPTQTVAPVPEKVVTWQDNPNKCNQDTQYISQDAPFACIDKPAEPQPQTLAAGRQSAPVASFGGDCATWIANAGITDVANANELIRRESGCNPYAMNASSGACGVAQELPCGKSGCQLGDGACQVRWMNNYVVSRYGSWQAAVNFHNAHNYY